MQARQGDIFFETVDQPVRTNNKMNSPVIAYGEVTGHSHKVMSPSLSDPNVDTYVDLNGDIYMLSKVEPIVIGHDEHDSVTLPANEWIVITRQREYDPLAFDRERRVAD